MSRKQTGNEKGLPSLRRIAAAWHGIPLEYDVRRNKMLHENQWEVVRVPATGPISDDTLEVLKTFQTDQEAITYRRGVEDDERAAAVRKLFQ